MRPLTAEQLLLLIGQFFPGTPALGMLEDAVRQGVGARAVLELAALLFGHDPKIFMLTARYEIGERELVSVSLDGPATPDEESRLLIEEYCIFGFWNGAAAFCPFSVHDHEAMKKEWRKLAAKLAVETPDPSLLRGLAYGGATRTLAAFTVGRADGGRRIVHFHRHPGLSAEMAGGFLRECILSTMPDAEA